MEKIKKYLGEILIIIGTAMASYNIFNFSYRTKEGLNLNLFDDILNGYESISGVAYFYSNNSVLLISIGFTLIVTGILIVKNKK